MSADKILLRRTAGPYIRVIRVAYPCFSRPMPMRCGRRGFPTNQNRYEAFCDHPQAGAFVRGETIKWQRSWRFRAPSSIEA
jgi:hypothetical protein